MTASEGGLQCSWRRIVPKPMENIMKAFVSVALAASLVASSAMAEPGDLMEFVATNDSSAAVQFFEDATGGELFVSIHRDGVDVSCVDSWEGQFDAVQVTGNGKHGAATIEPLGPVDCSPPLGDLTLECEFDDDFWLYNDGVSEMVVMGERTRERSRSWFATTDCTISVDGESLEAGGIISRGVVR
jgi:hypothetical protein